MRKTIRKILLKLDCIERAVSEHQAQQAEQRYHENWAQLMRSNHTVGEEDKPVEVRVECPVFIDSVQWGNN